MLQPIQTTGAMFTLRGKKRGIRKRGSNFYWDDAWFRQQAHMRARQIVTATAAKAAGIAKREMQQLGGESSNCMEYPAIQSGNLKDAIDSRFLADTGTWIIAIFGVMVKEVKLHKKPSIATMKTIPQYGNMLGPLPLEQVEDVNVLG